MTLMKNLQNIFWMDYLSEVLEVSADLYFQQISKKLTSSRTYSSQGESCGVIKLFGDTFCLKKCSHKIYRLICDNFALNMGVSSTSDENHCQNYECNIFNSSVSYVFLFLHDARIFVWESGDIYM